MNQTIVIEIPVVGAAAFGIVLLLLLAYLIYCIKRKSGFGNQEKKEVLMPFSEPMPGPKPVPPYMAHPMPVIPAANRNLKPIRISSRSAKYERAYSPVSGTLASLHCRKGQKVAKGDTVLTIKIGSVVSEVKASCSGILKELNGREGSKVTRDDLLFVIM